ncbi:hypothetical protein ACB092_04G080600 [Castanea dentata]
MRTDNGANRLLNLPAVKNMSVLTLERHPWRGGSRQHGIPHPLYFHPIKFKQDEVMMRWQKKMREAKRPHLWSFIGPHVRVQTQTRRPLETRFSHSVTNQVVASYYKCHKPMEVLNVMRKSEFCLQAPCDSFTRRSTFDAFLTGLYSSILFAS